MKTNTAVSAKVADFNGLQILGGEGEREREAGEGEREGGEGELEGRREGQGEGRKGKEGKGKGTR